jgi:hypothetical protein
MLIDDTAAFELFGQMQKSKSSSAGPSLLVSIFLKNEKMPGNSLARCGYNTSETN